MCTSTPKMPAVTPVEAPPMQQDEKAPEQSATQAIAAARKRSASGGGVAGGTLLTGPSGVTNAQTGGTTLLGG